MVKLYINDPNNIIPVPYKNTSISAIRSKGDIDRILAKFQVKNVAWRWPRRFTSLFSRSARSKDELNREADCPLCKAEKVTEWKYEDPGVWIAKCKSHPDKWMIVLKRHAADPSSDEAARMQRLKRDLFPGKWFRYPRSIPDHFHLHER